MIAPADLEGGVPCGDPKATRIRHNILWLYRQSGRSDTGNADTSLGERRIV